MTDSSRSIYLIWWNCSKSGCDGLFIHSYYTMEERYIHSWNLHVYPFNFSDRLSRTNALQICVCFFFCCFFVVYSLHPILFNLSFFFLIFAVHSCFIHFHFFIFIYLFFCSPRSIIPDWWEQEKYIGLHTHTHTITQTHTHIVVTIVDPSCWSTSDWLSYQSQTLVKELMKIDKWENIVTYLNSKTYLKYIYTGHADNLSCIANYYSWTIDCSICKNFYYMAYVLVQGLMSIFRTFHTSLFDNYVEFGQLIM